MGGRWRNDVAAIDASHRADDSRAQADKLQEAEQAEAQEDRVLSSAQAAVNAAKEQARLKVEAAVKSANEAIARAKSENPLATDDNPLPIVAQTPGFLPMTGAAGGGAYSIGWQDGYYGAITGTTGQGTARTTVGSNSTPLSAGGTGGAVTIAGTAALPVGFAVWMAPTS